MAAIKPTKPITLVGMMGCGKSTIGKQLASLLHYRFIDLDCYIENKQGLSVYEIFNKHGEEYFRRLEYQSIQPLLERPESVIALGGGAFIELPVRQLVKRKSISIWIRASFPLLYERLRHSKTRPLLAKTNKDTMLKELIAKRDPLYAEADFTVDSTSGPSNTVVDTIFSLLTNQTNG